MVCLLPPGGGGGVGCGVGGIFVKRRNWDHLFRRKINGGFDSYESCGSFHALSSMKRLFYYLKSLNSSFLPCFSSYYV